MNDRTLAPPSAIAPATGLSTTNIAAMLLLALVWGLSIPITKLGLATMPPLTLTALRFAVAVPLLLAFALGRRRLPLRALPRTAALGVLGIGIGQVAQTFGVQGTTASVGTIISALIPAFIVVFAALRLKQAVSGRQQIGLLAAFAGIALVAFGNGPDPGALSGSSLAGIVWMLVSSVAVAFYYVWSVELTLEYGAAPVVAWSTFFGFLALLPWTAWEIGRVPLEVTTTAVLAAVYLGLLVTAAGLFLWLFILRRVPAGVAAGVQYLQPVFGIAAAAAMFGDPLGAGFALGVILILGGLALVVTGKAG